jgi:hypothetical protein
LLAGIHIAYESSHFQAKSSCCLSSHCELL